MSPEKPYSNRELDKMHNEVLHKLEDLKDSNDKDHEQVQQVLKEIKDVVLKHSERIDSLERWKYLLIGMGIISQTILIPLAFKYLI